MYSRQASITSSSMENVNQQGFAPRPLQRPLIRSTSDGELPVQSHNVTPSKCQPTVVQQRTYNDLTPTGWLDGFNPIPRTAMTGRSQPILQQVRRNLLTVQRSAQPPRPPAPLKPCYGQRQKTECVTPESSETSQSWGDIAGGKVKSTFPPSQRTDSSFKPPIGATFGETFAAVEGGRSQVNELSNYSSGFPGQQCQTMKSPNVGGTDHLSRPTTTVNNTYEASEESYAAVSTVGSQVLSLQDWSIRFREQRQAMRKESSNIGCTPTRPTSTFTNNFGVWSSGGRPAGAIATESGTHITSRSNSITDLRSYPGPIGYTWRRRGRGSMH